MSTKTNPATSNSAPPVVARQASFRQEHKSNISNGPGSVNGASVLRPGDAQKPNAVALKRFAPIHRYRDAEGQMPGQVQNRPSSAPPRLWNPPKPPELNGRKEGQSVNGRVHDNDGLDEFSLDAEPKAHSAPGPQLIVQKPAPAKQAFVASPAPAKQVAKSPAPAQQAVANASAPGQAFVMLRPATLQEILFNATAKPLVEANGSQTDKLLVLEEVEEL